MAATAILGDTAKIGFQTCKSGNFPGCGSCSPGKVLEAFVEISLLVPYGRKRGGFAGTGIRAIQLQGSIRTIRDYL